MKPEPWEEPVGNTRPIKGQDFQKINKAIQESKREDPIWTDPVFKRQPSRKPNVKEIEAHNKAINKAYAKVTEETLRKNLGFPINTSPFLDTLVLRDDLNSQQRESALRTIEDMRGLLRVGWVIEG